MVTIRHERPEDAASIRFIHEQAFGQPAEAGIVDRLRQSCDASLSLVAQSRDGLVGHILFTPVVVESPEHKVTGMGLAPMAVLPDCQGHGIGSALVRRGIEILRERGCPFIVVLGHPEYYPRFGFERASAHGITSQWDEVPDEAFMILALDARCLDGVTGVASYRPEFDEAM
ncbi:MAG: N-acetyltransferase [Thermoleophilia bacterium]|nr:N-acetyltransferase [Thermoleophilia bacterium]